MRKRSHSMHLREPMRFPGLVPPSLPVPLIGQELPRTERRLQRQLERLPQPELVRRPRAGGLPPEAMLPLVEERPPVGRQMPCLRAALARPQPLVELVPTTT